METENHPIPLGVSSPLLKS